MDFLPGTPYLITTEKQVQLLPEAPWPFLVKHSTYAIRTVSEIPLIHDDWWLPTDQPHIAVNRRGRRYLVCTLDKNSKIRGSSEFVDEGTGQIFEKREISQWLPEQNFNADHFCVPIDSIREANCLVPLGQPDMVEDVCGVLDETSRELILSEETEQAREQAVMELTGCNFTIAMDIVRRKFPASKMPF